MCTAVLLTKLRDDMALLKVTTSHLLFSSGPTSRPATTDTGYQLGIHLESLKGTWHRPWGIIRLVSGFGHDIATEEGVITVRAQFDVHLGAR